MPPASTPRPRRGATKVRPPSGGKRRYTIGAKLTILDKLENGNCSLKSLAREFNVQPKQIRDWRSKRDKLEQAAPKHKKFTLHPGGKVKDKGGPGITTTTTTVVVEGQGDEAAGGRAAGVAAADVDDGGRSIRIVTDSLTPVPDSLSQRYGAVGPFGDSLPPTRLPFHQRCTLDSPQFVSAMGKGLLRTEDPEHGNLYSRLAFRVDHLG
ncbi:hypothetical protein HKX48_004898 [Thoreauomyces humboldtii]|nr:hypothetical protein HKX48_004898 [Thoreauomyces humboldtii]